MNVKMYLYPAYMDLNAARADSRTFFRALKKRGVEIQEDHWDGTVEGLPAGEPVIIRFSSVLRVPQTDLVKRCAELGHLCFYREKIILPDIDVENEEMLPFVDEFLARARERQMPKESVIPYLRSRSKDTSTLSEGEHLRRKAEKLLRLLDEHVLPSEADDTVPEVFASPYPVIRSGMALNKEEAGPQLGLDPQTIRTLKEQIVSDAAKLGDMGLAPLNDDPRAWQYLRKLRQGLVDNLEVLKTATNVTQNLYQVRGNPVLQMVFADEFQKGADYTTAAFGARHNTQTATKALVMIIDTLLPIVVEKLVAAGYPDSTDVLEWDYTAPLPPVTK